MWNAHRLDRGRVINMINEKRLIEELTGLATSNETMGYLTAFDVVQDCIGIVEKQPKVGEWIPCSERLPDKAGFYVVTKRQRSGEIQVALGSYRPLFNEWSGNGNFKDVLAWLPLPEPYKGE